MLTHVEMASMSNREEPFYPSVSFAFRKRKFVSRYHSCQLQFTFFITTLRKMLYFAICASKLCMAQKIATESKRQAFHCEPLWYVTLGCLITIFYSFADISYM